MATKNKTELTKPATVADAVANLYPVFRRYEAPKTTLDVCLGCCMDEKLEKEMRKLPLAALYRNHFYQYNDSAKSEVQPANEVKYFIPRMLELLSQGIDLHHSTEIYLDRIGRMPEGSLSDTERKALDDFALAFFTEGLNQMPFIEGGCFQRDDAFTILLMFHIGGFDIDPLLDYWMQQNTGFATLHYAYATLWHFWQDGAEIGMAFANDRPAFRQKMKAWITKPNHRDAFAERILNSATQLSQEALQSTVGGCGTNEDVLNEVFQYVAE